MAFATVRRVTRRTGNLGLKSWDWEFMGLTGGRKDLHAFAFDIDGVLLRGKEVIPQAREAMRKVHIMLDVGPGHWDIDRLVTDHVRNPIKYTCIEIVPMDLQLYLENLQTPKFPLCFVTNGGGMTEAKKANELSSKLGVKVQENQVILAHTPMRDLVPFLADAPVLLAGRGDVESVAKGYGFKKVVTTEQLARAMPSAAPFWTHRDQSGSPSDVCPVRDLALGTAESPFKAVLVFSDPADWARDVQLLVDVVRSGGVPGRMMAPAGCKPVEVYFGHEDLLWANDYPVPRFGQGAFSLIFRTLYRATTGEDASVTPYGKPTPSPFRLAQKRLVSQLGRQEISHIYMIGDNPAADVRGARNAGPPWVPVLVRSGVFSGKATNSIQDPADVVCEDVLEFIDSVL